LNTQDTRKRPSKKLTPKLKTLRRLTSAELRLAAGGLTSRKAGGRPLEYL
jgi:hypothetical protein